MKELSIIIPITDCENTTILLLNKAIESIVKQEEIENLPSVYIVFPKEIESNINEWKNSVIQQFPDKLNLVLIKNDGDISYQSQVNLAVDLIDSDYFTVLEFDDEFNLRYLKNIKKYINLYENISVFLPIIIETDENNRAVKYTNEVVWSQEFVGENGEIGYLNLDVLKKYSDFKLSGAIIKRNDFINVGKYKKNIKLTFMFEFLLRLINSGYKVFTVPMVGYKHWMNRNGSLFDTYQKTMPMYERKFWFETALKEYYFTIDRPIDLTKMYKN